MPNLEPIFDIEYLWKLRLKKIDWKSLLKIAYEKAKQSPDPSTQNAALLINEEGEVLFADVNRFPDGVLETPERWQRPLKYRIIEHAERNAIFKAAKSITSTRGLVMVSCWATCTDCARAIIQSGIKLLVTHKQAYDRSPDSWKTDIDLALQMLKEAGVEVIMYDGEIGVKGLRHSEKIWNP